MQLVGICQKHGQFWGFFRFCYEWPGMISELLGDYWVQTDAVHPYLSFVPIPTTEEALLKAWAHAPYTWCARCWGRNCAGAQYESVAGGWCFANYVLGGGSFELSDPPHPCLHSPPTVYLYYHMVVPAFSLVWWWEWEVHCLVACVAMCRVLCVRAEISTKTQNCPWEGVKPETSLTKKIHNFGTHGQFSEKMS